MAHTDVFIQYLILYLLSIHVVTNQNDFSLVSNVWCLPLKFISLFLYFLACLSCLSLSLPLSESLRLRISRNPPVCQSGHPVALRSAPGQTQPKVTVCRTLLRRWGTPAWTERHTRAHASTQYLPVCSLIKRGKPLFLEI